MRRIDEILALPYSEDEFKGQEIPPSDDDSWLYTGEDELNSALLERQKELELYNAKHKSKQKSKVQQDNGESCSADFDEFDPTEIAKTMKAFVSKVSSYKGAEVPENRFVVPSELFSLEVPPFKNTVMIAHAFLFLACSFCHKILCFSSVFCQSI